MKKRLSDKALMYGLHLFGQEAQYDIKIASEDTRFSYRMQFQDKGRVSSGNWKDHRAKVVYQMLDTNADSDLVEVGAKLAEILFPCEVYFTQQGVDKVEPCNKRIAEAYDKVEEQVLRSYRGDLIKRFISPMREAIAAGRAGMDFFKGNLFLSLYFRDYVGDIKKKKSTVSLFFPIAPSWLTYAECGVELEENIEEGWIKLNYKGKFTPESDVKGTVNLDYMLAHKTGLIRSLKLQSNYRRAGDTKDRTLSVVCSAISSERG